MKRIFWVVIVLLFLGFGSIAFASEEEAVSGKKEGRVSVEEILRNLDLDKNTKAHIQEYVKETKGKTAYGKGKVVEVISGKREFRIRIKVEGNIPPAARGEYNVTFLTENPDASKLNRGAMIAFEGTFQPRRGAFYGTTARQKIGLSADNIVGDYKVVK